MTTIADASTMPDVPVWVMFAVIATAVAIGLWIDSHTKNAAATGAVAVSAQRATCALRCHRVGTITRTERADLGGATVTVCPGHSDEGDVKAWWAC